ncbi:MULTISPECIES: dihydrofolate reductase family protein [Bradyrhizobium]|uniref:dihydrofolate reductase family protein n=1 Tax=Bradyrhizobium TaxID=374 RepID=UPI0003FCD933|nr:MULTISPECIES: dihydrofolate reductase family protein [Bradyrhizobium]AUC97175.1 dihydrofolate reductase [Bradyrhizobium sp. SK17]KIU48256.1 dihydrofolate reductase [Bradyrhizobium elkanii]MBK5651145.1 dihydrofolate reductase [Rhizobium sp.]OCX30731.1 dihydrofolate reductase [Bradyrhizobium sp. UASWS1016]
MRKIVVGAFISLDGVMQSPGGPQEDPIGGFSFGGWFAPLFDEKTGEVIGEMLASPFDLLLGRKTYDIFAAHWPYVDKSDPIGPLFDRITKYVATRDATRKLSWQNSETLGTDAVGALKELKQSDGPNLLTQGSSDFLKTLLAAGLVDELNLFIAPLILGKGKRLFADSGKPGNLKLVSSQVMPSGIIHAKYVPDGEVKTGSFEFETPTEAELERRKNLT